MTWAEVYEALGKQGGGKAKAQELTEKGKRYGGQGGLRKDGGVDSASIFYIFPSESPAYLL